MIAIALVAVLVVAIVAVVALSQNKNAGSQAATVTDADGNVYPTVRVGDQLWMAENLRTATCSDGAAIPLVSDQDAWVTQTDAAYTWGDAVAGDVQAQTTYGALYNGYAAALPCNICAALRCPCARRNRPMPPWGCVPAWPLVDGWFAPGKSSSSAPCLSPTLLQRCS